MISIFIRKNMFFNFLECILIYSISHYFLSILKMEETKLMATSSHAVILFMKRNKTGKKLVEVVPVSWLHFGANDVYCFYPPHSEYEKVEEMVKNSSQPSVSWQKYKIEILKGAENYDQGKRRMERSFNDSIIQSSNIDDNNSSLEEDDPLLLTPSKVSKELMTVPEWSYHEDRTPITKNKGKIFSTDFDKNSLFGSQPSKTPQMVSSFKTNVNGQLSFNVSASNEGNNLKTTVSKKRKTKYSNSDENSLSESPPSKKLKTILRSKRDAKNQPPLNISSSSNEGNSFKNTVSKKRLTDKSFSSNSEENSLFRSRPSKKPKTGLPFKKSLKNRSFYNTSSSSNEEISLKTALFEKHFTDKNLNSNSNENLFGSRSSKKPKIITTLKGNVDISSSLNDENSLKTKKSDEQKKMFHRDSCKACGQQGILSIINARMESMKRSLEHRIEESAKTTRELILRINGCEDVDRIMALGNIPDLPLSSLANFMFFENLLKTDNELRKKLICLMTIYICQEKISENLTEIIPRIMTKSVQIQYSAYGKEVKGVKKLNFSSTETCKCLIDVFANKMPSKKNNEILSAVSRWFSGASNREGGRRIRDEKKKQNSQRNCNKIYLQLTFLLIFILNFSESYY